MDVSTYQLTDEQKQIVDNMAFAFWADFKVKVKDRHVILYVDSWNRDEDYPTDLGVFEDPHAVMQAILEYPGYVNRSSVSAKRDMAEILLQDEARYRALGVTHMDDEFERAHYILDKS